MSCAIAQLVLNNKHVCMIILGPTVDAQIPPQLELSPGLPSQHDGTVLHLKCITWHNILYEMFKFGGERQLLTNRQLRFTAPCPGHFWKNENRACQFAIKRLAELHTFCGCNFLGNIHTPPAC